MPRTIVSRMRVPERVERSILARCRNQAVCDRFTGHDLSMLFGLANGAPGFSEQEAASQTGGPMWKLFKEESGQTILGSTVGAEIMSVPNVPRNVHAIMFELQGDLRTNALATISWTFRVAIVTAFGTAVISGLATTAVNRTSLYYRCLTHLMGHWKGVAPNAGTFLFGASAAQAIREDTGGQVVVSNGNQAVAPEVAAIGDLDGVRDMQGGIYAPFSLSYVVSSVANVPTLTVDRARAYIH